MIRINKIDLIIIILTKIIMSCKNCQAKTDKEFCDICQKCINIDKINKKCHKYFSIDCKICRQYNILKNSISCVYCGNKRQENNSLCVDCVKGTKLCKCEKRIDNNFKECKDCSHMSVLCNVKDCINKKLLSDFCEDHSCYNCKRIKGLYDDTICSDCKCDNRYCNNIKHKNKSQCLDHLCRRNLCYEEMYEDTNYCKDHKCKGKSCSREVEENFDYCSPHLCKVEKCSEMVFNYHVNYFTTENFCVIHKCHETNCENKKYKKTDLCIKCVCKIKNCDKIRYVNCGENNKCLNNCPKNFNLDYIKINDYFNYFKKNYFYSNILKCFYNLLLCLKKKNIFIPKDIRKILFYKYLEYKIIHCSSQRCYICNNLYLNTDQINISF